MISHLRGLALDERAKNDPSKELLVDNINTLDKDGQTLLFKAVLKNDAGQCRQLISQRANVNICGCIYEYNLTLPPLCQAVRQDNIDIAKMLIAAGAELHDTDNFLSTPLNLAINRGNLNMLRMLILAGCDVNRIQENGAGTPLHAACARGKFEIIKALVEAGADPNIPENIQRQSPGFYTVSVPIMQLLITHGMNVNDSTRSGLTLLHHAILSSHKNLVQCLIDSGAKLNGASIKYRFSRDNLLHGCHKQEPLTMAAEEMNFDLCCLLIQHGCYLDFLFLTEKSDLLLRIINSGDWELIMTLVYASGYKPWTSLVKYQHISKLQGKAKVDLIWDWLKAMSASAPDLRSICRVQIRSLLQIYSEGRSVWKIINKLPLPLTLQHYVALRIL